MLNPRELLAERYTALERYMKAVEIEAEIRRQVNLIELVDVTYYYQRPSTRAQHLNGFDQHAAIYIL